MPETPKMWEHQIEAVRKAREPWEKFERKWFAFLFQMGTGKTRTLLETLRSVYNTHGRVMKTLILAPPMVIDNWVNEWKTYTKIEMKKVVPLYGSQVKRLETFQKAIAKDPNIVIVCNYESLLMKGLFEEFRKWGVEVAVLDESHRCKSPSASRSKRAYELFNPYDKAAKRSLPKPYTYLLTGTPVLNSPMDIFQQFKIMDGGASFGLNPMTFRGRFFRDRNAGIPADRHFPKWELMTLAKDGVDAYSELKKIIYQHSMRVTKEECLDLPPEVSVTIKCDMSAEQKRLYKEMKQDFITYYRSKACVASLAITKALRLMQITSGFVAVETPGDQENARVVHSLPETPKYVALKSLLLEIIGEGHKVLVWGVHVENYAQIKRAVEEVYKELGVNYGYVEVHGGISDTRKRENVKTFQSDPSCRVFISHTGSGGIGINLTVAAYSIFYSRTFSLDHYLQARARNHRGGSKEAGHEKITHYDLVCTGTIDEIVVEKLANKLSMSDKILSQETLTLDDFVGDLDPQP